MTDLYEPPERFVYRCFHIDANRINARGNLGSMNQLEAWTEAGVIQVEMSSVAQDEASVGSSPRRKKAMRMIFTQSHATTPDERKLMAQIERTLFPGGASTEGERRDVEIVFNAKKYCSILVTADGGSRRQPGGILGRRHELGLLGIDVLTDEEAVALVKERIAERDRDAREWAEKTGKPVPGWVGQD